MESDNGRKVRIKYGPTSAEEARANLCAFSDEACQAAQQDESRVLPPEFPRVPKCFGWMKIREKEIPRVNPPVEKATDSELGWRWALVYEYVPQTDQDITTIQQHLDFFFAVGFDMAPWNPYNWHGGRLVDMNDVCSAFNKNWKQRRVCKRDARHWFRVLDLPRDKTNFTLTLCLENKASLETSAEQRASRAPVGSQIHHSDTICVDLPPPFA